MSTSLRVVAASAKTVSPATASLGERVQRLQAEARGLAREHIDVLRASLLETQALADEIALGGDVYPPGAREIAGRLREDSAAKALTLEAIMARL